MSKKQFENECYYLHFGNEMAELYQLYGDEKPKRSMRCAISFYNGSILYDEQAFINGVC